MPLQTSKFHQMQYSCGYFLLYVLWLGDPVKLKWCYVVKIATEYSFKDSFEM